MGNDSSIANLVLDSRPVEHEEMYEEAERYLKRQSFRVLANESVNILITRHFNVLQGLILLKTDKPSVFENKVYQSFLDKDIVEVDSVNRDIVSLDIKLEKLRNRLFCDFSKLVFHQLKVFTVVFQIFLQKMQHIEKRKPAQSVRVPKGENQVQIQSVDTINIKPRAGTNTFNNHWVAIGIPPTKNIRNHGNMLLCCQN